MLNRNIFILLLIFLSLLPASWAQGEKTYINYDLTKRPPSDLEINIGFTKEGITSFMQEQKAFFYSVPLTVNLKSPKPFIAFNLMGVFEDLDTSLVNIYVRHAKVVDELGSFELVEHFHHTPLSDSLFRSELMYADSSHEIFQFVLLFKEIDPGEQPVIASRIRIEFLAPESSLISGTTPLPLKNTILAASASPACACHLPSYVSRTGWNAPPGQEYSNKSGVDPTYSPVSHLIIHHSAGANNSNDWGATVLAIWDFHVNSNGWDDIGYNWLIAPDGQVFEGRGGGNNVVGAHFCGKNTGTMGICMLGTYEQQPPTAAAQASLNDLMAWKLCDAALDPLDTAFLGNTGLRLPVISGHQDGCATLCPGSALFSDIPDIRQLVDQTIGNCVVSSLEEVREGGEFEVFPNPNSGQFLLSWKQERAEEVRIMVLDSRGRLVYRENSFFQVGRVSTPLSLNHLKKGMYLVQVLSSSSVKNEKVLIQY